MLKPYLEAGKITGTQGLRGEIRVDPWCDSAEALCRLKRLYFEEGKQELKVVSARTQKRMAILKLEAWIPSSRRICCGTGFYTQAARILSWSRAGILFRIC